MSVRLLAAVGCVLVLAVPGCSGSSSASGPTYALLQMNLCLSGIAGCYARTAYPAVLDEAAARIRQSRPDAVTVNEACRGDIARIARETGYHFRFSRVIYLGKPLPCIHPTGRGLFGDAVLTKSAIPASEQREFKRQAGVELRRWLCVTTRASVDVCTAHLDTRDPVELPGNDAQCAELRALLARRAAGRTLIFGGDLNRRQSCAPAGLWTSTDASARQKPGLQQVYGTAAFRAPSAEVLPATHTDHDFLLVRAERR
ncbi:MAG TPA: endonuclease/exonuclease/phosphatase family protein [Thermoleophilaceae bacterium]|nr:endonuclease/exonuclease/phosphatase family protein [Thermoleophilaceae bacterium]